MANISYNKAWESEFDDVVSMEDKVQDLKTIQLKLEVHDTFEKVEKTITNFEFVNNDDVINKACLDEKLEKLDGHLSFLEKDYDEFKLQHDKHSIEVFLYQRAVKTTKQKL